MKHNGRPPAAERRSWNCSLQCPRCSSIFEVRVSQSDLVLVRQASCPKCRHKPLLTHPNAIWSAIMVHRLVRMRAAVTGKTSKKVLRSRRPRLGARTRD